MLPVPSRIELRLKRTYFKILMTAILLCFVAPQAAVGSSPLETVETGTNKVLQVLKAEAGQKQKRRSEIRKIVNEYFDFDEMSKRALGPHWNNQPTAKREEFTRAFSEFLFNVYIDKIEKYRNEKITYKAEETQGDHAVVDAVVAGSQSGDIPIRYSLHLKDGNWRAYDVVVEGIGLVNNYRSQFNSILSRSSFDDLLRQLRDKNLQRG